MHIIYNGGLMPEEELRLPLTNRAFQYNDGFFETMIVRHGKLRFWQDHLARMQEAAQALKLQLPVELTHPVALQESLLCLAKYNHALAYGRLKLKVWRSGAGLYTPETNDAGWLATAQPAAAPVQAPLQIGVCQAICTSHSPLSHFKGPNALIYTLAGVEKKEQQREDMLLLSREGHVSELISSNIFWIKNQGLFTPSLETGCVNGILRRNILRWCRQESITSQEVKANVDELLQAGAVFSANITGIRSIASVEGRQTPHRHPLLDLLREKLQLA